ncbi:MAG: hypothetical protein COA78_05755 [Blastopirellula sp.]|nr:MAG: hypothetical protein COA78_05755 [Blastopirellula sp.]
MDEINVRIKKRANRKFYQAVYTDPLTGKKIEVSTNETKKRDAERWAAKFEADLQAGRYKPASKITWSEFKERHAAEYTSGLADKTQAAYGVAYSTVDRLISPKLLSDIDATKVSKMQAALRAEGKTEDTIACYTRHLKAALNWAVEMGMMHEIPKMRKPKRAKGAKAMKGRPITGEEFDRMLYRVKGEVGEVSEASWKYYLRGLWLSGLRFEESLNLFWDGYEGIVIDLTHKRPMFNVRAEAEKGHQDRLLIMAPAFYRLLCETPKDQRTGRVFQPLSKRAKPLRCKFRINRILCGIGEKAGVKVNEENGKVKYASAQDLRRAFGVRWAQQVPSMVLKEMMRHESVATTEKFYVGQNADMMADTVWATERRDTSGDTNKKSPTEDSGHSNVSLDEQGSY